MSEIIETAAIEQPAVIETPGVENPTPEVARAAAVESNDAPADQAFDVMDYLTKHFEGEEAANAGETPGSESSEVQEPEDESATQKETADDSDVPAAAQENETEGVIETSDFSSLEAPAAESAEPVYRDTVEALKEKYPRQNNSFYEEAARYAAEAKKGREVVTVLGGEEFVAPMQQISSGLQSGNMSEVYKGVLEAGSTEQLINLIGHALHTGLVASREMQNVEEAREFGLGLQTIADKVLAARFGENITVEKLDAIAQLDKAGWLDSLNTWIKNETVDVDDFYDRLAANEDPVLFKSLNDELKSLKEQLAEKSTQDEQKKAVETRDQSREFSNYGNQQIEKILSEVVWKTSALRDVSTDTSEIKAEKSFLRDRLKTDAIEAFRAEAAKVDANGQSLAKLYQSGKDSAQFKRALTLAVNNAILQTKENTAVAERLLGKAYTAVRNAKFTKPKSPTAPDVQTDNPTQVPAPEGKRMTKEDVQKQLEGVFKAQGIR